MLSFFFRFQEDVIRKPRLSKKVCYWKVIGVLRLFNRNVGTTIRIIGRGLINEECSGVYSWIFSSFFALLLAPSP